jgi:Tol biopolymer transport system component
VKSKSYIYLFAGFFTILFLTGVILSCGGSSGGDDPPAGGPATVPAVVFIADKDTDGVNEIYVSLDDGDSVLKLSGTMVAGGDVIDFKISPDGTRVAFRADRDTDGVIELYVNSINGGIPIKVHTDFPFGRNVELLPALPANNLDIFSWSPNSNWIAYIADQDSDTVYELYVSAPDGSSNFKVSGSLVGNGNVIDFEWAPDNSRIAYRADEDTLGVYELYTTTPSATPTFNKVSSIAPGGGDVVVPRPGFPNDTAGTLSLDAFEWAPNSSVIAYVADQIIDNVFELFTVPPDGSAPPTEVSAISGSPFDVLEFKWAPDSSRIAYRADQNTEEIYELFAALPTGGVPVKESGNLSGLQDVTEFQWAPEIPTSQIAFLMDQDADGEFELFTAIKAGADIPVRVSANLSGLLDVTGFKWAPDSSLIAYRADQNTDEVFELFTTPPDGSAAPLEVSFIDTLVADGDVSEFVWAPDNSRIAYSANQENVGVIELYGSFPDGSANVEISLIDTLVADGDVSDFQWAPDSSRVAYLADQDTDGVFELFSSLPDGSGNGKISGIITPPSGDVAIFEYEP